MAASTSPFIVQSCTWPCSTCLKTAMRWRDFYTSHNKSSWQPTQVLPAAGCPSCQIWFPRRLRWHGDQFLPVKSDNEKIKGLGYSSTATVWLAVGRTYVKQGQTLLGSKVTELIAEHKLDGWMGETHKQQHKDKDRRWLRERNNNSRGEEQRRVWSWTTVP